MGEGGTLLLTDLKITSSLQIIKINITFVKKSNQMEVIGMLSEKDLELLRTGLNQINQIKFKIGELETAKHGYFKEIDNLKYSLREQENKIVKRYGKDAVIDPKTGEIKGDPNVKRSALSKLLFTK